MKIMRNPFGGGYTIISQQFLTKKYKGMGMMNDTDCRICKKPNRENAYEHIRLTEEAIKKIPNAVNINHAVTCIIKAGEKFNAQVQTYAKERKPDEGSHHVISTRESHRVKATGVIGLECSKCGHLFPAEITKPPVDCPICGETQSITDSDLIKL
jgi:rubrerythrin